MRGKVTWDKDGEPHYFLDGKEVSEKDWRRAFPPQRIVAGSAPGGHLPSCWPMRSDALAVHPKQVVKANERNRRHGVNVTYDGNGQAILPDRNERRKLMRLEGFHDKNGAYGD